jgi:CRISPR-associated protein Cas2
MVLSAPRAWLITYDIADPKRLGRLHRLIVKHAVPVQYSVFYFEGSTGKMKTLMKEIEDRIDASKDDVRAYQLPDELVIDSIGRGNFASGTIVFSSMQGKLAFLLEESRAKKPKSD